jgi:hypothetical protein
LESISEEKNQELKQLYNSANAERSKYLDIFDKVSKYCRNDTGSVFPHKKSESEKTDAEINDSTASLSITQVSDSMIGILLGDGNFFNIKPNQNLLLRLNNDTSAVNDYIEYVSKKLLIEINNCRANFFNIMSSLVRDYFSFGTVGLGIFVSNDYVQGFHNNIFEFLPFSVSDMSIAEGRNGKVENIFCNYSWSVNRIVKTFCVENGTLNDKLFDKLPQPVKALYRDRNSRETMVD